MGSLLKSTLTTIRPTTGPLSARPGAIFEKRWILKSGVLIFTKRFADLAHLNPELARANPKLNDDRYEITEQIESMTFEKEPSVDSGVKGRALGEELRGLEAKIRLEEAGISEIKKDIENLHNRILSFSTVSDFYPKKLSSSNSNAVTGEANSQALNGEYHLIVNRLATNEVWRASSPQTSNIHYISAGSFTINIRGTDYTVILKTSSSLASLAKEINSRGWDITAQAFDTGSGGDTKSIFSIQDNLPGKSKYGSYNLKIDSSLPEFPASAFGNSPLTEGENAEVYLNGSKDPHYSSNNYVNDLILGVGLQLVAADPSNSITISVSGGNPDAAAKLNDFVQTYNVMISDILQAIAYNPAKKIQTNPLAGDLSLMQTLYDFSTTVTRPIYGDLNHSSEIQSLVDLGISSDYEAGKAYLLRIDNIFLNRALATNYIDFIKFLINPNQYRTAWQPTFVDEMTSAGKPSDWFWARHDCRKNLRFTN